MNSPNTEARQLVSLGHVSGVHGVKGWVKVHSLTDPREALLDYRPWMIGEAVSTVKIVDARVHGKKLIVLLENIESREQAEDLVNQEISVFRDQFPELDEDQYYWSDLIGLCVSQENGEALGTIERMLATGANDVMIVKGSKEILVPFVFGRYVKEVDLDKGQVVVDWDPEF